MKSIIFTLLLLYSNLALTQEAEVCNELKCVDDDFKKRNYVKYYNILNKTLVDARGCKDAKKLDDVLEFTIKIKSIAPRERMAKFIEKEFISNPTCILSAIKRVSKDARNNSSLYLANPTYMKKKKIKSIIEEYKRQFPKEIHLILTGKELSK